MFSLTHKFFKHFLILFYLFPLCGCTQSLHKLSVLRNGNHHPSHTRVSVFEQSIEDIEQKNSIRVPRNDEQMSVPTHAFDFEKEAGDTILENQTEASNLRPILKNDKISGSNHISAEQKMQAVFDEALDFCRASQDFWQKGELEQALEALDKAYALILDIETGNISKLNQQKEDLRFMISKRILEIYASRNIVVNGDHRAIPMVMNQHIQSEIHRFTKGREKAFFTAAYKRSGKYRPYIVSELKKAGLPVELSWIPLIESGFKVNALSRAKALGLWQFIPSTGYKYGLKRDKYIDERIDPVKSTQAAIRYLKELHHIFGDWTTVLAAYNCGEGRVLKILRNQNIDYLDNFWDLYERLPMETARYVPRFMATLHIIKNPNMYGIDSISVHEPVEYEIVTLSKQIHLKHVAEHIGVKENVLRELNPELRRRILPKEDYPLRVPPDTSEMLSAILDKIPVSNPPQQAYVYHRVRPGENLSAIAKRYRTSVDRIVRANNLRSSHFIVAGKTLKVPRRGYAVYKPKKNAPAQ